MPRNLDRDREIEPVGERHGTGHVLVSLGHHRDVGRVPRMRGPGADGVVITRVVRQVHAALDVVAEGGDGLRIERGLRGECLGNHGT